MNYEQVARKPPSSEILGSTQMAEQDVKPVSAATGTFVALRPQTPSEPKTGNSSPETGNSMPIPERKGPDMEELARALNLASQSIGRDLRFEVDMESGRSVIQVLDRDTGEVIRQIPPDKADIYMSGNGDVQLRLYNRHV